MMSQASTRNKNESGGFIYNLYNKYKFPFIAFLLSIYAWFPKIQTSLLPLVFIPVAVNDLQDISSLVVHPFSIEREPHLIMYSKNNLSIYNLPHESTSCSMQKLEILNAATFIRSTSIEDLGIKRDLLLLKSFQSCDDEIRKGKKNKCETNFVIISSDLSVAVLTFELKKTHLISLDKSLEVSFLGCKVEDLSVKIDQHGAFGLIFAKFESENAKEEAKEASVDEVSGKSSNEKCRVNEAFLFRLNLRTGRTQDVQKYSEKDVFRDWSSYSGSLHGVVHDWHTFEDTHIESASVLTNQERLMSRAAAKLSMSSQPTIAETYGRAKKSTPRSLLFETNANAFLVKFSGGILAVNNHTLEPMTLIKLPNKEMNRSIHVIWDQEIHSVASIDIGSSLKTIGIPRIFAESRVLGQTNHIFQKLLSVQDLIGMTIEESLEDLRFLQPPVVFYAERPSKFDHFSFLSNAIGSSEPKFLFHIGYGTMKAYDLDGILQWKSETSAKWQAKLKIIRANSHIERTFKPAIRKLESINAFVIQGFDSLAVISELNGVEIATHSLPSHPVKDPIVIDFNSDGIDDIIVATAQGLVGFSLCPTFSSVQIWIFVFSLFISGFLFFLGVSINKFSLD